MALDQLASLLHRWQSASGALDRGRVVAEAGGLLRGLSVDERRELGRALAEGGVNHLAGQLDPHLPPPPAWEQPRPPAEQLLDLDARTGADLLARLDAVTGEAPPPPPPPEPADTPPVTADPEPWPEPDPVPDPTPPSDPVPVPGPTPQPHPEPVPRPDPLPEREPLPAPEPFRDAPPPPPVAVSDERTHQPTHAEARLRSVDEAARAADDPADLVGLLRRFPDGWQRRRAAHRLLERGALGSVDPVDLLRLFSRQSDRTRIAAALLGTGGLDVARLAGLLPDGAVHRLARRAARSRR